MMLTQPGKVTSLSPTTPCLSWEPRGSHCTAGVPLRGRCPRGTPRAAPPAATLLATTAALEPREPGSEGHQRKHCPPEYPGFEAPPRSLTEGANCDITPLWTYKYNPFTLYNIYAILDKMSSPYIVLKEETRMFGAAQIMNGLIQFALGHIWKQLYIRQNELFLLTYLPIVLISGYPFWASLFYVISGIFTIEAEKWHSPKLLKYTIKTNIYCSVLAVIGIFLTIAEITLFLVKPVKIQWPQESGIILSLYVCIFSILELYLANTVAKWGIYAFQHGNYPT